MASILHGQHAAVHSKQTQFSLYAQRGTTAAVSEVTAKKYQSPTVWSRRAFITLVIYVLLRVCSCLRVVYSQGR